MQKTVHIGNRVIQVIYDPRRVKRNMIDLLTIDGTPLYSTLQDSFFQTNGTDMKIDVRAWDTSNMVFDTIKEIKASSDEDKLAVHTADYLFNRFGGIYKTLMQNKLAMPSVDLWIQVCKEIWEWESKNEPVAIHKGTPYYFLAHTLAILGNWDSSFTFVFNAIEQDKEAFQETDTPEKYKKSPAYMFATLVDNRANTFYPYVKMTKSWLLKHMRDFRRFAGCQFKYADFELKFLRLTQLEEIVFVFVHELQKILTQEMMTTEKIRQNEFSKLRNLNTIFDLCLIVDKVLQFRYRALPQEKTETIADNVYNLFNEKGWLHNERHAGELKGEFTRSGTNLKKDPDAIVPKLLAKNVFYHGIPASNEMIPLLLVWHLRNYGGHNIKTQNVLVGEFPKIVEYVIYSLFLALA